MVCDDQKARDEREGASGGVTSVRLGSSDDRDRRPRHYAKAVNSNTSQGGRPKYNSLEKPVQVVCARWKPET